MVAWLLRRNNMVHGAAAYDPHGRTPWRRITSDCIDITTSRAPFGHTVVGRGMIKWKGLIGWTAVSLENRGGSLDQEDSSIKLLPSHLHGAMLANLTQRVNKTLGEPWKT